MLLELVIKQKLDFQVLSGVSVGALNASFLAQASTGATDKQSLKNLKDQVRVLRDLWRDEIEGNHSIYYDRAGFAGLALGADSLYSLKPLRRLLDTHLDLGLMRNSGRVFSVGTVSLTSGLYRDFKPDDDHFLRRVLASASIPVVFPYVDFEDEKDVLVDGGVRNITPLSSVFGEKPDEIYVLLTSRVLPGDLRKGAVQPQSYRQWDDNFLGTKVSGLDVLKRTVDILTDEIYLDDIRGALEWNEVLEAIDRLGAALDKQSNSQAVKRARRKLDKVVDKRQVPIHVLAPREWFGEHNSATEFSPELIDRAIEHGQEIAANPNRWLVK
jgi:NTE family protein